MRHTGLLFALLMLAPLPAQAAPRDDVMAGAFRCNAVAGDRLWLQCIYGAAQPLRARLGLPPAAESQIRLAQSPPVEGEATASPVRTSAIMGAGRCYAVADDRQWLDCYYGAVQPVRAALGMAPAPQAGHMPAPVLAPVANDPPPPPPVRRRESVVGSLLGSGVVRVQGRATAYSFDRFGGFTITLDDGEVWQQLPGDGLRARWNKKPAAYLASISDGSLGSFNLRIQGEDRLYKVQRVR